MSTRSALIKTSIAAACLAVVVTSGAAQALQNDGQIGSILQNYGGAAVSPACRLASPKLPICNAL